MAQPGSSPQQRASGGPTSADVCPPLTRRYAPSLLMRVSSMWLLIKWWPIGITHPHPTRSIAGYHTALSAIADFLANTHIFAGFGAMARDFCWPRYSSLNLVKFVTKDILVVTHDILRFVFLLVVSFQPFTSFIILLVGRDPRLNSYLKLLSF